MTIPLAERLRPQTLDDYIGQKHLVGKDAVLRRMIESGNISSFILWGPPGVGKTTLAHIVANTLQVPFYTLSAVSSGVKDVRDVIEQARKSSLFYSGKTPVLFIDEIHRFSKSQQDSLLGAVEKGIVKLIGATTENPSFEVIRPLLSRCQLYTLNPLSNEDLKELIVNALSKDETLKSKHVKIEEYDALFNFSGGDARKLLNILDIVTVSDDSKEIHITNELVVKLLQQNPAAYDKGGELHYDIISAAEDIGLANPNALLLANAAFDAVMKIGWPEGRIPLAEATIYLATSPKSNSAYMAVDSAIGLVKATGNCPVPLHLRNAPTKTMKELGYGAEYKYAHDYKNNFVDQQYMPDALTGKRLWHAQENAAEDKMNARMTALWGKRFEKK